MDCGHVGEFSVSLWGRWICGHTVHSLSWCWKIHASNHCIVLLGLRAFIILQFVVSFEAVEKVSCAYDLFLVNIFERQALHPLLYETCECCCLSFNAQETSGCMMLRAAVSSTCMYVVRQWCRKCLICFYFDFYWQSTHFQIRSIMLI